jgi:hypothetical protein
MDFDVAKPVSVTRIGVFDSNQDGLLLPITAGIYDRTTQKPLITLDFTVEDSGELIDGSRFKTLQTPLLLSAGFQGSIVAWGYGADEQNYNQGAGAGDLTTFDGGSLIFVGPSRYGNAGEYPGTLDGGPVNRYGAGTFVFDLAAEAPRLSISVDTNGIKINWSGSGVLEKTTALGTAWQPVTGATPGGVIPIETGNAFYRLRQ